MVPAGTARSVRAFVSREPQLREQRERIEHHGEHDRREQLLQHDGDQQDHGEQRDVRQPARAGSGERDYAAGVYVGAISIEELSGRESEGSGDGASCGYHTGRRAIETGCAWFRRNGSRASAGNFPKPDGRCKDSATAATTLVCEAAAGDPGERWKADCHFTDEADSAGGDAASTDRQGRAAGQAIADAGQRSAAEYEPAGDYE